MKPTRRHIDDIFAAARPVQPKAPLYSADELRAIVEQPAAVPLHPRRALPIRRLAAAAIAVATVATSAFFVYNNSTHTSRSAANSLTMRQTPRNAAVQPHTETVPTTTHKDNSSVGSKLPPSLPTSTQTAQIIAQPQNSELRPSLTRSRGGQIPVEVQQPITAADIPSTPPNRRTAARLSVQQTLMSPLKIRGLHFLELPDEALERLGITRTPQGYELSAEEIVRYDDRETRNHMMRTQSNGGTTSMEVHKERFKEFYSLYFGGDTTAEVATLRYKISLDTFSTACQPIRYPMANNVQPMASPLIISQDYYRNSNDEGRIVVTFENPLLLDSISKFSKQVFEMYSSTELESGSSECRDITKYSLLSKLVPVRIRMKPDNASKEQPVGSDIILWYYPSREFIEALPQSIADRLRIELGFTTLVEEGVLRADDLKQRYCGEYNFTDVCRTKDGAVSISSVAPNPASDRAMVKVHVTEQRNFSVSLHDIAGNRVAHLVNLRLADSDIVTIDVSDKPAGTYLIAITSDKGEQVVERLIVSR